MSDRNIRFTITAVDRFSSTMSRLGTSMASIRASTSLMSNAMTTSSTNVFVNGRCCGCGGSRFGRANENKSVGTDGQPFRTINYGIDEQSERR